MKEKLAKPKKYRQNTDVDQHFHPRRLARGIVHKQLDLMHASGVNKVPHGGTQSRFATSWRDIAEDVIPGK